MGSINLIITYLKLLLYNMYNVYSANINIQLMFLVSSLICLDKKITILVSFLWLLIEIH